MEGITKKYDIGKVHLMESEHFRIRYQKGKMEILAFTGAMNGAQLVMDSNDLVWLFERIGDDFEMDEATSKAIQHERYLQEIKNG